MSATVFDGWRTKTPGKCSSCGCADDWDCDGRGTVYCSCETCSSCGQYDGHEQDCPHAKPYGFEEDQ